jgi:hypothetical protein
MQPLYEVTLSRPWHWGIAILSAPGAAVPEQLDQTLVTGTPEAIVIKVRHAQDVDAERFEGDWDWAVATIRLRSMTDFESDTESLVYDGVLRLPGGLLAIGDADNEVLLNDLAEQTRIRLFATGETIDYATEIRVDLAPLTY